MPRMYRARRPTGPSFPSLALRASSTPPPPSAAYSYVGDSGQLTLNGSGVGTVSFDLGAAQADRVILVATGQALTTLPASVTAAGTTLSSIVGTNNAGCVALFSAVVAAGAGAQNVVVDFGVGSAGQSFFLSVWRLTGLSSNSAKHSNSGVGFGSANCSIAVDAGDFIFIAADAGAPMTADFSGSTEAPTARDIVPGTLFGRADKTIISTNAAFGAAVSVGVTLGDIVAATFI